MEITVEKSSATSISGLPPSDSGKRMVATSKATSLTVALQTRFLSLSRSPHCQKQTLMQVLIVLVPMLLPAPVPVPMHVPYEFRQFSILVPSGTRFFIVSCMFPYFVFRIITPILVLPRGDVYVLSQDINKFLHTKKPSLASPVSGHSKQLPYVACRWSPLRKAVTVE